MGPAVTGVDFQRVYDSLPGLHLVLSPAPEFHVLAASGDFVRTAALAREQLIGHGLLSLLDSLGAPQASARIAESLAHLRSGASEDQLASQAYPLLCADPRAPGWHITHRAMRSATGDIEYLLQQISPASHAAVAAVLPEGATLETFESTEELRAVDVLNSITEGFFALDREWHFTYLNREAEVILEKTSEELLGRSILDVYPGVRTGPFGEVYRIAMEGRPAPSVVAYYDDHDRWYEAHAYPAPMGISVYFRDVTAAKRAEAEREKLIRESEKLRLTYEVALSNTPDLVYVFDLEHRFTYANEALLAMWGLTAEESIGKTCLEIGYEPWHAAMHDREIDQVAATRQSIRGEVPFNGTAGLRVYDYILVPVIGANGDVVAVAGTTRDVTERQQVEQSMREQAQRLSESDRAKDEFLATLSHELRNPLAPLRNSLSLLRLRQDKDPLNTPIHEMMERQVNHLVRLVDDLLEMSRTNGGNFALRHERVEVSSVVRNAIETSEPLIQAGRHKLTVSLPERALWLEGDPVRLAQILANLLNNAAIYTDRGGRIDVDVREDQGSVIIGVRDNGAGIAPEALPRMFEMFSRGDRASRRGQAGLGIGLALARRLAQMHFGILSARSDGPGQGSEFSVRLPLAADQQRSDPLDNADNARLPHHRILVVDDNKDAGDSLGLILRVLGATVRIARDGAEALEIYAEFEPDVVLLDIGMPGMDGYEVARTLRATYTQRQATIVALTGWGQDNDRRQAKEAGFDHHLIKPAEIGELRKLLLAVS